MKKVISVLFFTVLFLSCSTKRATYFIVSETINELHTPNTLDIVENSYLIQESFLKFYQLKKSSTLSKLPQESGEGAFHWFDEKYSWILTNEDIESMLVNLKKQKEIKWDLSKVSSNHIPVILVKESIFDNYENEEKERVKRSNQGNYLYKISNPLFNKNEDLCVISYYMPLFYNSGQTLIYKKNNRKWILIGSYYCC